METYQRKKRYHATLRDQTKIMNMLSEELEEPDADGLVAYRDRSLSDNEICRRINLATGSNLSEWHVSHVRNEMFGGLRGAPSRVRARKAAQEDASLDDKDRRIARLERQIDAIARFLNFKLESVP